MKFLIALTSWLLILSGCAGYRLLGVFPLAARSHFMMYEELMKTLARKGHQMDVISVFPLKKPLANYNDLVKFPAPRTFMNNFTYTDVTSVVGVSAVKAFVSIGGNTLCPLLSHPKILQIINDPPTDPPYDALITELFGAPCYYVIGHLLKLPIIAVSSSALYPWSNDDIGNPENLAFMANTMLDYPHMMTFWQRVHNVVHTAFNKQYYKYMTNPQDDMVREIFGEGLPTVRELETRISLVLANTHMSLVGTRPTTPAYIEVGGLHVQDTDVKLPPSLEKWMNESTDGFVYFTFGSMVLIETFPREVVEVFYRSLGKLAPIRVLMKVPNPSLLPPGMPKNIHTQSWMPQVKVLKHPNIKAFITHGGLMGTQEAIYCGVPLIGIPLFADQFINIQTYVSKKIAVHLDLDSITEEKLDAALDAILNDPVYRETMRDISYKFRDRPMSPGDTANYWIEYVIRHGADVLRSPAMNLTWWQLALLDVYAFLLFASIVILLAIATTLRFLLKLVSNKNGRISPSKKVN